MSKLEEPFAHEMRRFSSDFNEFFELMKQTTANLKRMSQIQNEMRWQFGEPKEYL